MISFFKRRKRSASELVTAALSEPLPAPLFEPRAAPATQRQSPQPETARAIHQSPAAPQPAEPETLQRSIPDELVAARAYEIWKLRGCPSGQDGSQDWHAAKAELERERLGAAAPNADDRRF